MSDKLSSSLGDIVLSPMALSQDMAVLLERVFSEYGAVQPDLSAYTNTPSKLEDLQFNQDTGVGIIPITGMLVDKYDAYLDWAVGITAYENILNDAYTMLEAGAKTIVQHTSSGGGQAYGMLETSASLRKLVDKYGSKLITYNDGLMASAAIGLGSVSHEVITNPEAESGSVGVVVSLTNYSEAYKKAGIERSWITAGENKTPFNKDGSFKQAFLDDIQSKVDKLYERFTAHVAQYRNVSQDAIKALGANVYTADEALANGLVDKIMTREEFFNYLAEVSDKGNKNNMISNLFKTTKAEEMSQQDLESALLSAKTEWQSESQAKFDAQLAEFKTALAAEYSQKESKLEVELAEAKAALAEIETQKAEAKTAERKASLAAVLGEAKAEEQFATLSALSDEAFASVVGLLASTAKTNKEADTMLAELGDEGQEVVTEAEDYSKAVQTGMQLFLQNQFNKKGAK